MPHIRAMRNLVYGSKVLLLDMLKRNHTLWMPLILCIVVSLTGCSPNITSPSKKSSVAASSSKKSSKSSVESKSLPVKDLTHVSSENLTVKQIVHYKSTFFPEAYSSSIGAVSSTPVASPGSKGMPKSKYLPQRVLLEKSDKYLPQPLPSKNYGNAFVQTNGNWITWMYLSNGGGFGDGEKLYAYNISSKKTKLVWTCPKGAQLFEVQLYHGSLYFGVDYGQKRNVVKVDLKTGKKTIVLVSPTKRFSKNHAMIVYDFHVSDGYIGVITAPLSQITQIAEFPYSFNLYTLSGKYYRSIFKGIYPNQFDMASSHGVWVWSSGRDGVYTYSLNNPKQVDHISNQPSSLKMSGNFIEMHTIMSYKASLFNLKDDKYVNVPKKYKVFTITDGIIALSTNSDVIFSPNGYDLMHLPD